MSQINVDTIGEKTSANGVTIDSVKLKDGAIDQTAKIVSGIDTFHCVTSSISGTLTGLLFNPATNTFYSPSSGIVTRDSSDYDFEFTSTGVYQVYFQLPFSDVDPERRVRFRAWATTDASVPTASSTLIYVNEVNNSDIGASNPTSLFISGSFVLNISNTNTRIKFFADSEGSTQSIVISTTYLHAYVQFTKIGNSI